MKHIFSVAWILMGSLLVASCADTRPSTTPALDARFGEALNEAKRRQSLPVTAPVAEEAVAAGVGQPTSTETAAGLQAQQRGRSVAPAFGTAR